MRIDDYIKDPLAEVLMVISQYCRTKCDTMK